MMMEAEAAIEVKPTSPGQMLREVREARGLKVDDVVSQLKLSRRQVEALEADAFAELPGLTFVRGFVRNYARLLEIDADPILALLDRHSSPDTTFEIKSPPLAKLPKSAVGYPGVRKQPYRLPLILGLLAAAAVGGFALFNYTHVEPELQLTPATSVKVPEPVVATQPEVAPVVAPAPAVDAAPTEPVAPTTETTSPVDAAKVSAVPGAVSEAPAPASAGGQLRLTFEGDSWVDIRDADGNKVASRLYRPGAEETLSGKPPFKLVIGNAAQVKLFYNGQPVDLAAHVKVNVARLQLD